jgi:hypothetical protein
LRAGKILNYTELVNLKLSLRAVVFEFSKWKTDHIGTNNTKEFSKYEFWIKNILNHFGRILLLVRLISWDINSKNNNFELFRKISQKINLSVASPRLRNNFGGIHSNVGVFALNKRGSLKKTGNTSISYANYVKKFWKNKIIEVNFLPDEYLAEKIIAYNLNNLNIEKYQENRKNSKYKKPQNGYRNIRLKYLKNNLINNLRNQYVLKNYEIVEKIKIWELRILGISTRKDRKLEQLSKIKRVYRILLTENTKNHGDIRSIVGAMRLKMVKKIYKSYWTKKSNKLWTI